ncbi:sigma-70 family RNA polymerase sigma factor [Chthonobacter rhizosphaerae]|uniref:sigma-70 family RNA polymerase sigma factor n=1 Tax=Chthonobacter rhizosphaerae TaxID=2735553 RepID=UPI0015EEB15A|nr:sigma-70 family RNA polymerase sigma factor [Chthonobacter rhizosphaerae]
MADETFKIDVLALLPAMQAYARALTRNGPFAEDLVQETFARAVACADQFRPGTNLKSWVLRIERNLWFSEYNRQRREQAGCALDAYPGCCSPDQEWRLHHQDMMAALRRLRPEHRDVLVRIGAGGTSYIDAARQARCEVGTIKSRLNRAREALSVEMGIRAAAEVAGQTPGPQPWHGWQVVLPS